MSISTTTPKEIATGFAAAVATLCLGVFFSVKAGGDTGTVIVRIAYYFAALLVLKFSFAWGRLRGFPIRTEDGGISLSHVVRNLVMAVIVGVLLVFTSAPLIMAAFELAR